MISAVLFYLQIDLPFCQYVAVSDFGMTCIRFPLEGMGWV